MIDLRPVAVDEGIPMAVALFIGATRSAHPESTAVELLTILRDDLDRAIALLDDEPVDALGDALAERRPPTGRLS